MYKQVKLLLHGAKKNILPSFSTIFSKFSTDAEEIIIPKAIPRGPTDILKALSRTVNADPTAAHYKYHDDPYLIPYSNPSKRSYALSQEAGRKAAQWIRQEHSELFQHRVAEPIIEAFLPRAIYDENSVVNEEVLKYSISNLGVSDSITIYNILKKKGEQISNDVKQSLLELVCYYNCEDPLNEDWIEERWYRQGMKTKDKFKNTWKENGFAEQLFKEIEGNDGKSLCALISGMCLHGEIQRAWDLYEKSVSDGTKLNTTAYNALLAKTCFVKESHAMVLECIQALLQRMAAEKISPNLGTLNSTLESLSYISSHKPVKTFAFNLLSEFKSLGFKPSLSSFYHLLNIFNAERRQLYNIVTSLLDYLENNSIKIEDIKDVLFFSRAMEAISSQLRDKNLAYRLYNLLHKDDNYNFIGDSYKESIFYRFYFLLLIKTEALDTMLKVYDSLVPHVYIPEPTVMGELLNSVEYNNALHLLPRLWSDIVIFEQADRTSIMERVLGLASKNTDEKLNKDLANIGWTIWEKIENTPSDRRGGLEWTGPLLGDLMIVLLANEDLSKAHLVMDKMERLQNQIIGEPKVSALINYIDLCIKENSPDAAIKCIRYCHNIGFIETDELARKVNSLQLKPQQLERLISIVGADVLKSKKTEE